ncbi:MAG: ATP-grasp domain-containing protein [Sedimentisphaerales bacterium]
MVSQKRSKSKNFNILFTCIGRRVSLLNSFRKAAKALKLNCQFLGTEKVELNPAFQLCDKKFIVKSVDDVNYIKQVLQIVKQNNVKLLVPTIDLDLQVFAESKDKFAAAGCTVLISKPEVISIAHDKRLTYKFLVNNGFDTPVTYSVQQALTKKNLKYPCFLKPWDGYASKGTAIARNHEELVFYVKKVPNCIVQEFIRGKEFTCGIYIDFNGRVRCVVPRRRIETRAGEVSKGQTVKDLKIMHKTAEMVKKLGAGPGVINVQLILTEDKQIKFIEINPRFGGGTPLSIKAGADFPIWILQGLCGKNPKIKFDGFKNNLVMLRYDAEVWLENWRRT